MYWIWIWLAVAVLASIIEIMTSQIVAVWFVPSAIVAMILAVFDVDGIIQIVVFAALSAVLMFSLRRIVMRFLFKNKPSDKTNTDLFVGRDYLLLSGITQDMPGTVKINGVVWNCIEKDGNTIEKDARIVVRGVSGNKLVVEKAN